MGIFGATWLAVRLRLARLPQEVNWLDVYGAATLGGIGFTMSLFIGSLAFEHGGPDYASLDRIGILAGSLVSAVWGYVLLRFVGGRYRAPLAKADVLAGSGEG